MIAFTLPFPTPSQNTIARWHFGKVTKHRNVVTWLVRQRMVEQQQRTRWRPIAPGQRRRQAPLLGVTGAKAALEITRHSAGTLDMGNLIGGCKHVVDALVLEGLLFDDSPEWLDASYHQARAPRGKGRTVVRVWYRDDGEVA